MTTNGNEQPGEENNQETPQSRTVIVWGDMYCPKCKEKFAVFGSMPGIKDRIPVQTATMDADNNLFVYGVVDGGETMEFSECSAFECIECGAKWDSPQEIAAEVLFCELERTATFDDDDDEEDDDF